MPESPMRFEERAGMPEKHTRGPPGADIRRPLSQLTGHGDVS
jgi:hypothetical protein